MKNRTPLAYLLVTLKGLAMGAADVVPGVSGGTIAFISGIYEELIDSINKININSLMVLRKEGIKQFWKHVNGTFLLFLFLGILVSILSLSKVVLYLLENHPILIWSFFFGLVVASAFLVAKSIKRWGIFEFIFLIVGTIVAYYISSIQSVAHVESNWYIFLCGAVAICAMILPGISGSFILVLMGAYYTVLTAIHEKNYLILSLFAGGCLVGLLSFARLLKFLFTKFKAITVAVLTGFMIGSLYKVWPWKKQIGTEPLVIHSNGKEEWMTANVLPNNFEGDNFLIYAIAFAVLGYLLIVLLEKYAPKENN